eukprot:symbB.v1.2.010785.t1/scaffold707.1/size170859/6
MKQCSCVGIRSCALCTDPSFREAFGLHPVRSELPSCTACYDLIEATVDGCKLRREDGQMISGSDLPVAFEGLELFEEVLLGGEEMERHWG